MQRSWRVGLTRPFPIYRQLVSDNSCGPRAILMVTVIAPERGLPLKSWALLKLTGLTEKDLTPRLAKLVEELVSSSVPSRSTDTADATKPAFRVQPGFSSRYGTQIAAVRSP